jgi:hypothetical protein
MMRRWLALLLLPVGCSLGSIEEFPNQPTLNECEESSECGGGVCVQGACRARQGSFSTILFEVSAPTAVPEITGVQFLSLMDNLPPSGGNFDLVLRHVAHVTGTVIPTPAVYQDACAFRFADDAGASAGQGADNSIPAKITFIPVATFLGLSSTSYTTDMPIVQAESHTFDLRVPPGDYHIYVRPHEQLAAPDGELPSCAIAPQLFRNQTIASGDVTLSLTLPPPERLLLHVRWPIAGSLDGWALDLIDPISGRRVSTRAELNSATATSTDEYLVELAFSPVQAENVATGQELVRLAPPEGVSAPVLLMERSVIELFSRGEGVIDGVTLPPVVEVEGQVVVAGSLEPQRATVILEATELSNVQDGTFASYSRIVESDTEGKFRVPLLPGQYRIQAVPEADSGLAATETNWAIDDQSPTQAGKVIELVESIPVSGTVLHPSGRERIEGPSVHAVPSPGSVETSVLDEALGAVPFVPRAATATVVDRGGFSFGSDPGIFDVSVRPGSGTGFAWLVMPNLEIRSRTILEQLNLPLPVAYRGVVKSDAIGPLPGALIRAFIYLDQAPSYTSDPLTARSVLQIAETRSGDDGGFDLLLPAELTLR